MKRAALALAIAISSTFRAFGCPECGRDVRQKVWAGVFDGHFSYNVAVMALPFVVCLALVAAIYWSGPTPRR
jgi:hypothetical protein